MIHEFHFFCIHRLIHWPPPYRHVHSVHHNSVNPSPWSSLSMHPVEHLLYWSGALIHPVVPSHPLLALYHLHISDIGAVVGHIGFDGVVPLDRLFGTAHDGSGDADERMNARLRARAAKLAEARAQKGVQA